MYGNGSIEQLENSVQGFTHSVSVRKRKTATRDTRDLETDTYRSRR